MVSFRQSPVNVTGNDTYSENESSNMVEFELCSLSEGCRGITSPNPLT